MAKFPTYEEMGKKVAEKALDEFLYDGRSIREWMHIIASEDAISRQAVLNILKDKWNMFSDANDAMQESIDTIEALQPVKLQEPCEDAIDRKEALYLIGDYDLSMGQVVKGIHALPPVTPKPKTGHWEWVQYDYDSNIGNWHCSECKNIAVVGVKKNEEGGIPIYKYCPNCGAKMVDPQESENKE